MDEWRGGENPENRWERAEVRQMKGQGRGREIKECHVMDVGRVMMEEE
jgi:hypothetical protein